MILGEQIAELRKDKGYTQKQLAEALKISQTSLSNYENGVNYPDPFILMELSNILKVSVDFLLGITNIEATYDAFKEEKIGHLKINDFNKQILELDKEHRKMMCEYLKLVKLS